MNPQWKFLGAAAEDEEFRVDGINVWNYEWQKDQSGAIAHVKDPLYHHDLTLRVHLIELKNRKVRFAAGELSNGVWGFYVET